MAGGKKFWKSWDNSLWHLKNPSLLTLCFEMHFSILNWTERGEKIIERIKITPNLKQNFVWSWVEWHQLSDLIWKKRMSFFQLQNSSLCYVPSFAHWAPGDIHRLYWMYILAVSFSFWPPNYSHLLPLLSHIWPFFFRRRKDCILTQKLGQNH